MQKPCNFQTTFCKILIINHELFAWGARGRKFESFHPDKIKTIDNQHNMLNYQWFFHVKLKF